MAFGPNFVILSTEFLRAGLTAVNDSKLVFEAPWISKENKESAMNKLQVLLIAGAALVMAAQPMLAQHQHGGGSAGGGGFIPTGNPGVSEFQKAIALQATAAQSAQVLSWMQSTAALSARLGDLSHMSETGKPSDVTNELEAIKEQLEDNNISNNEFAADLSTPQRSALKKHIKRLGEASHALAEAFAEITRASGETPSETVLIRGVQRARKAIAIEQQVQQRLADEMGVTV